MILMQHHNAALKHLWFPKQATGAYEPPILLLSQCCLFPKGHTMSSFTISCTITVWARNSYSEKLAVSCTVCFIFASSWSLPQRKLSSSSEIIWLARRLLFESWFSYHLCSSPEEMSSSPHLEVNPCHLSWDHPTVLSLLPLPLEKQVSNKNFLFFKMAYFNGFGSKLSQNSGFNHLIIYQALYNLQFP